MPGRTAVAVVLALAVLAAACGTRPPEIALDPCLATPDCGADMCCDRAYRVCRYLRGCVSDATGLDIFLALTEALAEAGGDGE
ncbi:MAG: hypothetical protein FJ087_10340 [Deltaproteobacteria bacterium]|nr:hypothetical protein [Deltaproteobacteria bacterium]